jgi:hypothetical protein
MSPSKDIWYSQKAAGHWKGTIENVLFRVGFAEFGDNVEAYTAYVHEDEARIREEGWEGWVAYEGHGGRKQVRKSWMWKYRVPIGKGYTRGGLDKILEWIPASQFKTLKQFDDHVKQNRGMGWQFPKIYVFFDEPDATWYEALRREKVPYINAWEYSMIEDPKPEEPDTDPIPVLKQLPPFSIKPLITLFTGWPKGNGMRARLKRVERKVDWIAEALSAINKRSQGF